jgi:lysine/ornithine N-monooxygenase
MRYYPFLITNGSANSIFLGYTNDPVKTTKNLRQIIRKNVFMNVDEAKYGFESFSISFMDLEIIGQPNAIAWVKKNIADYVSLGYSPYNESHRK